MEAQSDIQLLREYAECGNDAAFCEIVNRHTDLVYSAALRQVDSPDLAADIAQTVFVDLARKAKTTGDRLKTDASLLGWLYRSTRFAALKHFRDDRRRAIHERQAMEQLLTNSESAPDWEALRPILDEAMAELDDEDRDALLLRYFKNQDFRAVGHALGTSDDAAQKRVSRAVERLRGFLSRRGIAAGTGGLTIVLSANAVQAAPAGLAATISTAATVAGITAAATITATATVTQAITMTALQKTIIGITLAAAIGTGVYQTAHNVALRREVRTLEQRQAPLTAQIQALQRERDDAANRMAALAEENATLKRNPTDVLKLRGEVGRLRQESAAAASTSALDKVTGNPEGRKLLRDQQKIGMEAIYSDFAKRANLTPEQAGKLTDLLADHIMECVDRITEVLRDGNSPEQLDRVFAAQDAATAAKLEALLGAEAAAQYKEYTRNLGSSLTVQQFRGQLTGDQAARDDKASQLRQLMQQETQAVLAEAGLPPDFQTIPMLNFRNIASETEAEKNLKLFDDIYARVAEKAASFLEPEEVKSFNGFREKAMANSRTALVVNRRLMAPMSK